MSYRVGDVYTRAEHGDGVATLLQSGAMRRSINPTRHATNDRDSATNKGPSQGAGDALPICR